MSAYRVRKWLYEIAIEFDGDHPPCPLDETIRERPASRSDLDDGTPFEWPQRLHNAVEYARILEEMLPESLARGGQRTFSARGDGRRAFQIHVSDSRAFLEWTIHDDGGEIVAQRSTACV